MDEDTEVKEVRDISPIQINRNSPALKARSVEKPAKTGSTYINIPFYGPFMVVNREPVTEQDNINAVQALPQDELEFLGLEADLKKRRFKRQLIREGYDPNDPAFQPAPDVAAMQAKITELTERLSKYEGV